MAIKELTQQYRRIDKDCADFYRFLNDGGDELEDKEAKEVFIPTKQAVAKAKARWELLKKSVEDLEEPDKVFSLVKHHFIDFVDSLEYILQDAASHPEGRFLRFNWYIDHILRIDRKSDEEKCKKLVAFIQDIEENYRTLLEIIKESSTEEQLNNIANTFRREITILKNEHDTFKDKFVTFTEEQTNAVLSKIKGYCQLLNDIASEISTDTAQKQAAVVADDVTKTVKLKEEEYRKILNKKLGVSLDELLDWHKSEIEKTRKEAFEIAAKLNLPNGPLKTMGEVNDALFLYEGPCNTPEEMLARANEYLKRTRALAHEFVSLPEDEICICAPISECCKDSYPWGGYEGGDFTIRPFKGQMFLNHYNYKNVTDGWIKLNALHEAYPGHHTQYIKTAVAKTPETVKIGAKLVPILEGTCLRTERAFEFIFGEDPFFPLFVAYRRHHASVRIFIDIMLFYHGATLEEAIKVYQEELGFEYGTARKQVQAHQNMPGYFTCYYYGMKKLCQWEEEYGFNKKDYTELLFSAGYISLDRFKELIELSSVDRERYFNDFESLLKKDFVQEK